MAVMLINFFDMKAYVYAKFYLGLPENILK